MCSMDGVGQGKRKGWREEQLALNESCSVGQTQPPCIHLFPCLTVAAAPCSALPGTERNRSLNFMSSGRIRFAGNFLQNTGTRQKPFTSIAQLFNILGFELPDVADVVCDSTSDM